MNLLGRQRLTLFLEVVGMLYIYICYIHLHLGMKKSTRKWQSAFVAMRVRRQINPQEHYIHDENIRVYIYIYIMKILQKQNREI